MALMDDFIKSSIFMSSERLLLFLTVLSFTFFASMLSSSKRTKLTAMDESSDGCFIDALFAKSRRPLGHLFQKHDVAFLKESFERA